MPPAVAAPPLTHVEPVTEILHGVEVTDPYRWLEDQNSPRTRKWIEEQTAYTRSYFDAIPGRGQIRERVQELLALKEVVSEPWNIGDRYFFLKRQGNGEQPVIVARDGLSGPERILVDPADRGTGESTAVGIVAISDDGRFLAYSVRQGGTDHSALEILDVEQGRVLPDGFREGFCTGFAFAPDCSGFYYSHRELSDPHPNYRAAFWHQFGTDRSQDEEIFFAGEETNLLLGVLCSPEANLLAYPVFSTGKMRRTSVYLQKIPHGSDRPKPLLQDIEGCVVPFFVRGQLFAYTDFAAPNFRVAHIDIASPDPSGWHDVVPETEQRIQQFSVAGDQIIVTRVERFTTTLELSRLHGDHKAENLFSTFGSIDLLNRTVKSEKVFYSQTSISHPSIVRCYDTNEKRLVTCDEAELPPRPHQIEVEEVAYPSRDKTSVPLLLAARKDRLCSGPLPTFLTGYGGFGNCVTPRFTAFAMFLIEQGFLFALPALRGGSNLASSGIEQVCARIDRIRLMTLLPLPSGSLLRDEVHQVASQSGAVPMQAYWSEP